MTEQTILYLIGNAFRILLIIFFYTLFFQKKRFPSVFLWLYGSIYFVVNSYMYLKWNTPLINTTNTLIFLYLLDVFYIGKWQQYVFFPVATMAILIIVETVAAFFPMINSLAVQPFQAGLSMILHDFIFCFIVLFLKRYNSKKLKIPVFYWISLFIIPFLSILIEQMMVFQLTLTPLQMVILFSVLIVINILTFILYDRLSSYYLSQNELLLAKEKIIQQNTQIELQKQSDERVNRILHDLNNHINVLHQCLDEGNIEEAKKYLRSIGPNISQTHTKIFCGNPYIDSILAMKSQKMEEENIAFYTELKIPKESIIDDGDMCTILFNLLDNAIEAQQNLASEHKFIKLTMLLNRKVWMIRVINSCDPKLKIQSDKIPATSKVDSLSHGYGLKNVIACAEKYDGTCSFTADDGKFISTVFLVKDLNQRASSSDKEQSYNKIS